VSHGELVTLADATASALRRRLQTVDLDGARVAILVGPGVDWVRTVWGVWRAGGVAVPLCVSHPVPELDLVIEYCRPSLQVVYAGLAQRGNQAGAMCNVPVVAVETVGGAPALPEATPPTDAPARGALLVYTSGTTGGPKGALHTHRSLAAQVDALLEAWGWTAGDRIANVLPLLHVHGIVYVVCCALAAVAR
jgi:malonyl-CoA/methylmalonyl-CoA synthetase